MSCSQVFATIGDYVSIWRIPFDGSSEELIAELQIALDMAHGNIYMALAAADACECNLPTYTVKHLKKLVVIDAAVKFKVSCGPSLSDELRETYIDHITSELENITTLKVDPCGGTGSNTPAVGVAEQLMPGINATQILNNALLRNQDNGENS